MVQRQSLSRKGNDSTYGTSRRGDPGARCAVRYRPQGSPRAAEPGTLEHFLAERYILYAGLPDGSMRLGRVHHTPYPLEQLELHGWAEGLLAAAGTPRGAETPSAPYAAGVHGAVLHPVLIPELTQGSGTDGEPRVLLTHPKRWRSSR